MKTYFDGTLEQLQQLLAEHGITGSWEQKPHGVHMQRCSDRLQVHWSSTRGTVWFSGASIANSPEPVIICSAIKAAQAVPSAPEPPDGQSEWDAEFDDDDDDEDFGLEPWMYDDDDD